MERQEEKERVSVPIRRWKPVQEEELRQEPEDPEDAEEAEVPGIPRRWRVF